MSSLDYFQPHGDFRIESMCYINTIVLFCILFSVLVGRGQMLNAWELSECPDMLSIILYTLEMHTLHAYLPYYYSLLKVQGYLTAFIYQDKLWLVSEHLVEASKKIWPLVSV